MADIILCQMLISNSDPFSPRQPLFPPKLAILQKGRTLVGGQIHHHTIISDKLRKGLTIGLVEKNKQFQTPSLERLGAVKKRKDFGRIRSVLFQRFAVDKRAV